jgi:hypothetical protein
MTLNYSIPAQNIICFDLLNSSWDAIYFNAIILEFPDFSIEFMKIKYDELHSESRKQDSVSKLYFEGIFLVSIVCLMQHDDLKGIANCITYEVDLSKPISISNSDNIVSSIQSSFIMDNNLTLSTLQYNRLLEINKELRPKSYFKFEKEIINLELTTKLKFTVEELFTKFNIRVLFEDFSSKLKINRFKLTNIFYRNQLPIAFSFQHYGKIYIAWNEEFLKTVFNINSITTISMSKTEQLNAILDRINEIGLKNITEKEMFFLNSF